MACTHAGPFTCTGSKTGWRWHCLVCDEISRPYCSQTDCLMDFTRTSRRLQADKPALGLSN